MGQDDSSAGFALDDLKWEHRVLVVGAPSPEDERIQNQRQAVTMSASDFIARDMVLVEVFEGPGSTADDENIDVESARRLRDRLGILDGTFEVFLIGKDGTVKLRDTEPVPMRQVYALIDTMPMRRREMRDSSL